MNIIVKSLLLLLLPLSLIGEEITAVVKSIDETTGSLVIQPSGDVNGQTQLVKVSPGDLAIGYVGQTIRGKLAVSDGVTWLNRIWPVDAEKEKLMASVNKVLHADTAVRQRREYRRKGDVGINFAMFNEQGKTVQFEDYKGEWIIMNFIFTRCRMPEMCPAQTARMVDLQKLAKAKGISNLRQLSVTFDPKFDTPGILNQYSKIKGADPESFSFLTGPYETMLDLLKQYGVIAFESKNIIDHTVTTLLFDKTGKVVLRRDGTKWSEKDFLKAILKGEK